MSASLFVALCALQAAPGPWPVEPQLGVSFAMTRQALTVDADTSLRAPSGVTAASLGIGYRPGEAPVELGTFVSLGLGSLDGHGLLGIQQRGLYRHSVVAGFSLLAGLALSATLDTAAPAFSSADLAVVLGVRLWRFELLWQPGLQLPLGSTTRLVADATVVQSMATTLTPLSFSLRFAFGP